MRVSTHYNEKFLHTCTWLGNINLSTKYINVSVTEANDQPDTQFSPGLRSSTCGERGEMGMSSHSIVALFFFFVNLRLSKGDDQGLGASFVFGDSLVDAGNNNYLQTLSKANIVPNGIDFQASGGNPTGRYTNGRTIGDIIGILISSFRYMQKNANSRNSLADFWRILWCN